MSSSKLDHQSEEKRPQHAEEKEVYIYAEVDIDRAYS